jgi:hypothetical protein
MVIVEYMKIRSIPAISIAAFALVACSADVEVAVDDVETLEAEVEAEEVAEEPAEETSTLSDDEAESETETTVAETAEGDADTSSGESEEEVAETTVPPTTSTTEASGEEMADELELIEILGIAVGAGSGEYVVVVGNRPEGLERFKLSLSGADGYCTPEQFNNQGFDNGNGTYSIDWFSDTCGGSTVGVAWVHEDGRRSGISYHTCEGGVSLSGELC